MKESTTYQAILRAGHAEGAVGEARRILLALGSELFGDPSPSLRARVESLSDLVQLESLIRGAHKLKSWDELLGVGAKKWKRP